MNEKIWNAIRTKWNRNYIYDFLKWYPDLSYSDLVNAPTTAEYEKLAELGVCSDDARPLWDTIARRKVEEIKKKKYMAQHFNDVSDTGSDNQSQQLAPKDRMIVRALYEIGNQLQNLNDNLCSFHEHPYREPVLDSFYYHDIPVAHANGNYITYWYGAPVNHNSIADPPDGLTKIFQNKAKSNTSILSTDTNRWENFSLYYLTQNPNPFRE